VATIYHLCGVKDPHAYYREVAATSRRAAARLRKRYERLALLRLILFFCLVAGLILIWSLTVLGGAIAVAIVLPLAGWGIRHHSRINERGARTQVRAELAEQELRALDHRFSDFPDGSEYVDAAHPYATDLDIFGPNSLFQYLNRSSTAIGADRLADYLRYLPTIEMAESRVAAGRALAGDPDWCLDFRVLGQEFADNREFARRLTEWVRQPAVTEGSLVTVMRWLAPLLTTAGLWFCFTQQPWQVGLLFFVPAFLLLRKYREAASRAHAYTATAGKLLTGYGALFDLIDRRYPGHGIPAASAIGRLSYFISQLDVRYNPFVFLLEISGIWSLQWLRELDTWRKRYRDELPRWLDTLAEIDARVSLATLRFNHPDWTDAELTHDPTVDGIGLGHPLIPSDVRVTNDLTMATDGHIHLVTGSNMAGKSTWLRTVGLNLVLARMGSPVCARHLRTAALQIWTSMRTQDDLSERTSSFFAELKRLKAIITAVTDSERRVFFLLDEILKGTNSRDRHTGARALIRQLIRERGAGIIATHDLELAALENEAGSRVENYAMEVRTQGEELVFDYKLHRGVSRSFNATVLMARMGIDIDPRDVSLTHD
jgi:hypothetical protein